MRCLNLGYVGECISCSGFTLFQKGFFEVIPYLLSNSPKSTYFLSNEIEYFPVLLSTFTQ